MSQIESPLFFVRLNQITLISGNYHMEGKDNRETLRIDIDASGEGKIEHTGQYGEREFLLEGNIEGESWINKVISMHKSRKHKRRKTSDVVSIYQVPQSIKESKREAYDPLVVFLGPYHHKKHQELTAMDEYKLQAVDKTLERLEINIEKLVSEVKKLEKQIRDCYEDSAVEWDEKTLAWMMTMDACFILEVLRMEIRNSSLFFRSRSFFHIKRREIMLDILKLENQIPLCVLKRILELEVKDAVAAQTLLAEHLRFYVYFNGYPFSFPVSPCKRKTLVVKLKDGGARHLLDLSRQVIADFLSNSGSGVGSKSNTSACYGAPNGSESGTSASNDYESAASASNGSESAASASNGSESAASSFYGTPNDYESAASASNGSESAASASNGSESAASASNDYESAASASNGSESAASASNGSECLIPSAAKLRKAGIHLKASTDGKFHFKRGCFGRGTLSIPQITVDDQTEIFLRNLVAFEECQMNYGSPIKPEISLNLCTMDKLIDSKEDVKLFQRDDIIKNYLGTEDEVAKVFNDLCIGVTENYDDDFRGILEMVNKHHKNPLNRWISEFWEKYCSKPWYFVSAVAAVLLLAMTLLQTIYTIKGYVRSP